MIGHYHPTKRDRDACPVCHPRERRHRKKCPLWRAFNGRVAISCEKHGWDGCPQCYPCTCPEVPELRRVPNSHLTWCRLLTMAYGSMARADEELACEPWGWEPHPTRPGVLIRLVEWQRGPGGGLLNELEHPHAHDRSGYRACDWVRRITPQEYYQARKRWCVEHCGRFTRKTAELYPVAKEVVCWHWVYRRPSCEVCQVLEDAAQLVRAELQRKHLDTMRPRFVPSLEAQQIPLL